MRLEENDRLILVTNDDGYYARGMRNLLEVMTEYGRVICISSNESQSARSQALTVKTPLRHSIVEDTIEYIMYRFNGTPADGVKLAMSQIVPRKPDLLVSGINHGSNASVSVFYSGTMGAAIEGCLYGIPSIGFSLCDHSARADFRASREVVRTVTQAVIDKGLPRDTCLNVNIPVATPGEIRGIKLCRQAYGRWVEEFDKRTDPQGRDYFWLTGAFVNEEPDAEDTDEWALSNTYASVVPVKIDLTHQEMREKMQKWDIFTPAHEQIKKT